MSEGQEQYYVPPEPGLIPEPESIPAMMPEPASMPELPLQETTPQEVVPDTPERKEKAERTPPKMSVIGLRARLKNVMDQSCNALSTIQELSMDDEFKGKDGAKVTKQITGQVVSTSIMIPIMKIVGEYMQFTPKEIGYVANIMAMVASRSEDDV